MNRKKKMNATLKKRNKKEKAKLAPKNKTPYISKAKRAEMENEGDSNLQSETAPGLLIAKDAS